jgi:hypothetical protein
MGETRSRKQATNSWIQRQVSINKLHSNINQRADKRTAKKKADT